VERTRTGNDLGPPPRKQNSPRRHGEHQEDK
jgi:hypothetical protein